MFIDAGLDVSAVARDPWTGVLDDITDGTADLALGGLWVPAMYAGGDRKLSVVAQLNHQFPMGIVTREPVEGFDLSWLAGKVALAPGAGGSAPFEFTAGLIRESGNDPRDTRWVRDLSTAMLVELYQQGLGDAIIADLTTAHELQAAGRGTIVFRHLDSGGIMPNSVYYTRTDLLEPLADRITRFTAVIQQAMDALPTADPAVIDRILLDKWQTKDLAVLRAAVGEMLPSAVWDTVVVDRAASDRWMGILEDAGLVATAPTYEQLMAPTLETSHR